MKHFFTIGEIGKILGLTNDAIRFYEKKGLVHPSINDTNHYRLYSFYNVLELLDVIYYRELDISLDTIMQLYNSKNPNDVISLMEAKEKQTRLKIHYETQLLKKLMHIKETFYSIERHENIISIKDFPESLVVFEGKDRQDFFAKEIKNMTKDQFVLCTFYISYINQNDTWHENLNFVSLETTVIEQLNLQMPSTIFHTIPSKPCLHYSVKMSNGKVNPNDILKMQEYALSHHLTLENTCFVREVPITFYSDYLNYYAEIFIPIVKNN